MICNSCKKELIWGSEHSYEAYGRDGEGIVGSYSCPNPVCKVEDIIIYTTADEI